MSSSAAQLTGFRVRPRNAERTKRLPHSERKRLLYQADILPDAVHTDHLSF